MFDSADERCEVTAVRGALD